VRLFFDEDTGRGVPDALLAVGIQCEYVSNKKKWIRKGSSDELWIPYAGKRGLLVFSCNKAILEAEGQRALWIDNKVGGVFLTSGQERKVEVLIFVLRHLEWLGEIDETPRPFAYMVNLRRQWKRESLVALHDRSPDEPH
jgi:hypothetical protein